MVANENVKDDLKEIVRALRDALTPLKDMNAMVTKAYSDAGTLKSSVDKLFEIVVTGNGRESLMTQITVLCEQAEGLENKISDLRKEYEEEKKQKATAKMALIVAMITSIVGPIIVAIITATALRK